MYFLWRWHICHIRIIKLLKLLNRDLLISKCSYIVINLLKLLCWFLLGSRRFIMYSMCGWDLLSEYRTILVLFLRCRKISRKHRIKFMHSLPLWNLFNINRSYSIVKL